MLYLGIFSLALILCLFFLLKEIERNDLFHWMFEEEKQERVNLSSLVLYLCVTSVLSLISIELLAIAMLFPILEYLSRLFEILLRLFPKERFLKEAEDMFFLLYLSNNKTAFLERAVGWGLSEEALNSLASGISIRGEFDLFMKFYKNASFHYRADKSSAEYFVKARRLRG